MKKFLLIAGVLAYCGQAVYAQQQPSEYTFKVTPDELNLISDALGGQPFNKVVVLMGKLRQQIVDQQVAPVMPPHREMPPFVKKQEELKKQQEEQEKK